MPTSVPVPARSPGDLLTSALWNAQVKDNINKLLDKGHRTLTVAQFAALTGLEGTKGVVAGDEVYLEVDAANGVLWHLVYESGETTYKWRFLGGPPLLSEVFAAETTNSAAYTALATAGPAIALPRAGDYDVEISAQIFPSANVAGSNNAGDMSYDIGGTAATSNERIVARVSGGGFQSSNFNIDGGGYFTRTRRKAGLTSVTLTAKYRQNESGTVEFARRLMRVVPTRIRHDA